MSHHDVFAPDRARPAALLRAEIDRLLVSHGGLVLVSGEAGIGKTTQLARRRRHHPAQAGVLHDRAPCLRLVVQTHHD
jgi:predicted ATP-dependent serine protease